MRLNRQPQFSAITAQNDRHAARRIADEQLSIASEACVEPLPINQAVAVVTQRARDADSKSCRAFSLAKLAATDATDIHLHHQIARLLAKLPREQMNVAIWRRLGALDPAARNAPILQRICPILRSQ